MGHVVFGRRRPQGFPADREGHPVEAGPSLQEELLRRGHQVSRPSADSLNTANC